MFICLKLKKIIMRNFIYLFIILGLLSCSNTDTDNMINDGKKHEVNFNISSFNIEQIPIKSATRIGQSTLSPEIKQYGIYIYNASGVKVAEQVKNNINDVTIPNVKFELAKGDYTATIIAFNDIISNYYVNSTSLTTANATTFEYRYDVQFQDCSGCFWGNAFFDSYNYAKNDYFYKKLPFTVTQNATIDVTAPRVTGRIELHIKDINVLGNYPSVDYAYVRITTTNMPHGVKFGTGLSVSTQTSTIYMSRKEWESYSSKPLIFNCMPTANPKITFEFSDTWASCYDPWGGYEVIKHKKEVSGFEVFENKITRLTGDLFTSGNFNISIDPNFSEVITGGL